jgi:phosphoglycolate phosphatase-like HAD superfamily hydrolase
MATKRSRAPAKPRRRPLPKAPPDTPFDPSVGPEGDRLAMLEQTELGSEPSRGLPVVETPPEPRQLDRGLVVFDMDGTLLDSIGPISDVAADVLFRAFGTPPSEGRLHYLATTGMPFEAQLSQLYPDEPAAAREQTARLFHHRKVLEAYAHTLHFAEVPGVLRRLSAAGWTLVISTGAEREMADLLLEREGLRYWFEDLLGSGQGTKREHLREYLRRYPGVPVFLVGDSRFDMEAASDTPGVIALGRASSLLGWTLTPDDLKRWGARWADFQLNELPAVLDKLEKSPVKRPRPRKG